MNPQIPALKRIAAPSRRPSLGRAVCAALVLALAPSLPAVENPHAGGPSLLPQRTVVARIPASGTLERSTDAGTTWAPVNGLPARVLPAYRAGEGLPVTAFAVAPGNPADPAERAAIAASPGVKRAGFHLVTGDAPALAAVGGRLFVSTDRLESWREIDLSGTISPATYVTAVAIDPRDHRHWLIGTSYDGVYRTQDGGRSWVDLTQRRALWPIYLGAGFFEEVAGLWFTASGAVLLEAGFGQGFYELELDPLQVRGLGPLAEGPGSYARLGYALGMTGRDADAAPRGGVSAGRNPISEEERSAASRRAAAANRTGIYLAPHNATNERLDEYFDYLERHGFNSVVVDFKDDYGRLTYASELPKAIAAGAVTPIIDPHELMRRARERGIYVIARVVVFQDRRLFAYDDHRYALWDSVSNRPWGVFRTVTDEETEESRTFQVEFWVDPWSPEVWQYNVDVAREIAGFGVDEIQFDYIRFPSDGDTSRIESRFAVPGADRVQALEGFLAAAREAIDLPIGIDVFGFNAWSRMNYLGQDMQRLADYVDVISPMFYPSHFARSFLPQYRYLDRAWVIYDLGTRRSIEMAGADTLIRPYIQAFLIGAELEFDFPTYRRYLDLQVEASIAAGASGYTLWNASGRYYMLP